MKKLVRVLSLTAGLGVAVALVGQFNSGTTRAVDIDPVRVINSTSNPVPVTGNVKASQSGAWTVGINGIPTVNVASAPPVNVNFPSTIGINGTVPVTNQNSGAPFFFRRPLIVDAEEAARNPFAASCTIGSLTTGVLGCVLTTVPGAGDRLIIETVSGHIQTDPGQKPVLQLGVSSTNATAVNFDLQPIFLGNDPHTGLDLYQFTIPVRIYADSGATVEGILNFSSNSIVTDVGGSFQASGHFANSSYL
jgi:hypothetical protein